ncbi:MAG: alpha/beta hydrolase-fold protein [Candidatus Thorarchaeota archaeon]|jgi:predicted alpha/beta superfamily hydrolase
MSSEIVVGKKIVVKSEVLGEDRIVLVSCPKNYEVSNKRYPMFFLLDAEFFFQQGIAAVGFLSECGYIGIKPIPEMITVGIVNVDRNRDYTPTFAPKQREVLEFPTSGKADIFLEFLKKELIPLVEERYRTHSFRILAGWSLGGLLTIHSFLFHPDLFSAYLAISPSLWWDEDLYLERTKSLLSQGKVSDKPLVVTIGSLEGGDMGRSVRDGFIPLLTSHFEKSSRFKAVELPLENHSFGPYKAIFEGLRVLYSDDIIPEEIIDKGLDAVNSFYENLSKKYGYKVLIPESTYSQLASNMYSKGEESQALEVARTYLLEYPESSYAHYYVGVRYLRQQLIDLAEKHIGEALEMESSQLVPDSEKIFLYNFRMQEIADKKEKSS